MASAATIGEVVLRQKENTEKQSSRFIQGIFLPYRSWGKGPVDFGKIVFVPSKLGKVYSV